MGNRAIGPLNQDSILKKNDTGELIELLKTLSQILKNSSLKRTKKYELQKTITSQIEMIEKLESKNIQCHYLLLSKEEKDLFYILNRLITEGQVIKGYDFSDAIGLLIKGDYIVHDVIADDHFTAYLYFDDILDSNRYRHLTVAPIPYEFYSLLELENEFLEKCSKVDDCEFPI